MSGIYFVFSQFNTFSIVIFLVLFLLVSEVPIQLMRNHFEGSQYQVAWSADWGGYCLLLITLIGIGVLQRGHSLPESLGDNFQATMGIISFVIGAIWLATDWKTQKADRWHHIIVAPLQIFLFLTMLPVLWGGPSLEFWYAFCLFVVFIVLLLIDVIDGRLPQRRWQIEHLGTKFKNETEEEKKIRIFFRAHQK